MIEVKKVKYAGGYKLALTFTDGSRGVVDMEPELHGVLAPLRDKRIFRHVSVVNGSVSWGGGKFDIAPSRLYALAHGLPRPRTLDDADANERDVSLRQVRELAGLSQVELADHIGTSQGQLSRLEHKKNMTVASLRRYVEACGGKLRVTAEVGGKQVVISG
jgi:DNA-binding XRE family transcriptional regulator